VRYLLLLFGLEERPLLSVEGEYRYRHRDADAVADSYFSESSSALSAFVFSSGGKKYSNSTPYTPCCREPLAARHERV
jgi:hypothetical protein